MGLTRLRAEQISDIDYKQAVRVITVADITNLSGGAPSQVDGVNLVVGDRILVTAQDPGSENGIYQVQTLGTGSNGTWIRSIDTNATGELEAGTIVMVTEGTTYADTQWKLTTNNPIVIGTTPLTFVQNSADAFGNIYANGTAILANSVGSVLTLTPGDNIQITGNNTTKTVTIAVTGVSTSNISNGTSNVTVVSSGGNVTVGIGGTANVAEFSTGGLRVTGFASATGNVTGGNILTAGLISATGNLFAGNALFSGNLTVNGNVTYINSNVVTINDLAINLANNAATAAAADGGGIEVGPAGSPYITWLYNNAANTFTSSAGISAVGNISGSNLRTAGLITATGNLQAGNVLTSGLISATSAITSAANIIGGNLTTAGLITATGNVTGGNILTAGLISATSTITSAANITGGNLLTAGLVSATGNVTGNYFIGNGSQLTGISVSSNSISNGTSNVVISTANGNINMYVAGQDTVEVSPGELTVYGVFSNPKTISSNVVIGPNINSLLIGPISVDPANNIFVPTGSTLNII